MRVGVALLALLVVMFAAAGVARADLFTAPVYVAWGDAIHCHLTNVSKATINVVIEIKDKFGATVVAGENKVPSGTTRGLGLSADFDGAGWYRCKFVGASQKNARAHGLVEIYITPFIWVSVPAE